MSKISSIKWSVTYQKGQRNKAGGPRQVVSQPVSHDSTETSIPPKYLQSVTVAILQLGNSNGSNLMGGGHHHMRNSIKGSQCLGRLRTTDLDYRWSGPERFLFLTVCCWPQALLLSPLLQFSH